MAGAGYKLFNTGDVLTAAQVNTYLMQQTVMVFANATARNTALSGVVAQGMQSFLQDTNTMQYYNGSAWVTLSTGGDITSVTAGTGISGGGTSGDVTITNSMATAIDAKGDLIAGTADNTFSRLAVGSNGETLVADSAASTGLRWQGNYAAGKNKVLNGSFNIWQRGTSFSPTSAAIMYTADRFYVYNNGSAALTASQQSFTAGSAPVSGYEATFFHRVTAPASLGTTTQFSIGQRIEDVRTFAGETVTISYWAKVTSSQASAVANVGVQQNFGSGGSSSVSTYGVNPTMGTSWARYSHTISVPSISSKTIGTSSYFAVFLTITAQASQDFDIWGVQVEAGSVATAFQTATGTLQGEFGACARYYYRVSSADSYRTLLTGYASDTGTLQLWVPLPSRMRVAPAIIDIAALANYYFEGATAGTTPTSITVSSRSTPDIGQVTFVKSGSFTQGNAYSIMSNNTSAFVGFSAEL